MSKKILVIDDSKSMLQFTKAMLEELGFEVAIAASGREGLDAYTNENPDMVLLDIEMPVMDGYETLRKIIQIASTVNNEAVVFMLSGKQGTQDVIKAIKEGAKDYLVKPIDQNAFLQKAKKFFPDM